MQIIYIEKTGLLKSKSNRVLYVLGFVCARWIPIVQNIFDSVKTTNACSRIVFISYF